MMSPLFWYKAVFCVGTQETQYLIAQFNSAHRDDSSPDSMTVLPNLTRDKPLKRVEAKQT